MNVGNVKFIKPKSKHLQQFIKGYYTHTSDDPDFQTQIAFYQNITSCISIYEDTQLSFEGEKVIQTHTEGNGMSAYLVVKVNKCQEVEFRGPLNRLAIVFYPLGLNYFIRCPLSELVTGRYCPFYYFDKAFESLIPRLYATGLMEEKRDMLDDFLNHQFQDFKEKRLIEAVYQIIHQDTNIKVEALAKQLNMSRRTLLRLFKKHLYYSVEEYCSIVKFRKSLLHYQSQDKIKLTEIALESDYYDQADFNHQFKYRTGMPPKALFSKLEIMDDVLFWKVRE